MDNIKRVVKDVRFLIARDCCDETIQSRIENFINEREQALRIHDVSGMCSGCDWIDIDYKVRKCLKCGKSEQFD